MVALLGQRPVSLGGLELLATDDVGVDWIVTDVKGWDSASVRAEFTARQSDHGAWGAPVYLGARSVTITGSIQAPDMASRDVAVEQLLAAASFSDTLLVIGESTPKQALVRRSGEPLVQLQGPYWADYSLLMTASDPRRYSTVLQSQTTGLPSVTGGLVLPIVLPVNFSTTSTGGAFILTNEGTIATRPTFTVTGPAATFMISCTQPGGQITQLTYSDSIGVGDTLVIDTDAHTVMLNGTASRRRYLSGTWPEILPGSSLSVQWSALAYDAAAMLTGTCRSAWM